MTEVYRQLGYLTKDRWCPRGGMGPSSKDEILAQLLRLHDRLSFRSEEHTSELHSLMRISYAFFCLKKNTPNSTYTLVHDIYIIMTDSSIVLLYLYHLSI